MTKVFLYLANRSIRAGFLILAVIGLRFSFPKAAKRASTAALGSGCPAACGSLLSGKSMEPASKR